jgi:hypothetical protein
LSGFVACGVFLALEWSDLPDAWRRHLGPLSLAVAAGSMTGATELLSRYRDAPLEAAASPAGILYTMFQATASAAAYGLLVRYGVAQDDLVLVGLISGFGAMAVLRAKLLTIRRPDGTELEAGPALAIDALLRATDDGVARSRAVRRLDLIFERVTKIKDPSKAHQFFEISVAAFQNVGADDKAQLVGLMDELAVSPYPELLRVQAMAYLLIEYTGELGLNQLIDKLEKWSEIDRETTPRLDQPPP